MQLKRFVVPSLFVLAAAAVFAADDSKPVALTDTPPAVQKTIAAQIGAGKLGEIDQGAENGKPTFDVSFTTKNGDESGFTVGNDGTVLSVEVALAATPPAVQKTIQAQAVDWQVEGISESARNGKYSFDVGITKDGQEKNFTVDDDGTLSSMEVALADTPAPVQKTIQTQGGDWEVKSIDKSTDESGTSFDVNVAKGDQEKRFTVDDDGTLSSVGVALADTPTAVQNTIQLQAAGWQVESVDKATDETGTSYDIEASKGGWKKSFTITDDGYLESMEVALAETPGPVQAAIQKQLAGDSLKSIEESFDPAGNSFDVVSVGKDGGRKTFTISADGTLASQGVTLDQTTPEAHATIVTQVGDGAIKSIDESFDPPVNTFDVVAVMKNGTKKSFTVGAGGWMRSEEVSLDDTSAAAKATILEKIGGGKIVRIDKAWAEKKEDGVVPFEVQGRKDGQPFNFAVGPKGKFLGMD